MEKERARETAILNEMEQMSLTLKARMKQLAKLRQETSENSDSYRNMANAMIEKLDRRRESQA